MSLESVKRWEQTCRWELRPDQHFHARFPEEWDQETVQGQSTLYPDLAAPQQSGEDCSLY